MFWTHFFKHSLNDLVSYLHHSEKVMRVAISYYIFIKCLSPSNLHFFFILKLEFFEIYFDFILYFTLFFRLGISMQYTLVL